MDEAFVPYDIEKMPDVAEVQACIHGNFWAGEERGCVACPSGHYCPEGTMDYAFPCPAGTYNNVVGQWSCLNCPPGFFCPEMSSQGTLCPPGKFNPIYGMDRCVPCPVGQFCPEEGEVEPSLCEEGTWTDKVG